MMSFCALYYTVWHEYEDFCNENRKNHEKYSLRFSLLLLGYAEKRVNGRN